MMALIALIAPLVQRRNPEWRRYGTASTADMVLWQPLAKCREERITRWADIWLNAWCWYAANDTYVLSTPSEAEVGWRDELRWRLEAVGGAAFARWYAGSHEEAWDALHLAFGDTWEAWGRYSVRQQTIIAQQLLPPRLLLAA